MHNHKLKQIGARIKQLRKEKRLTQEEFAKAILRDRSLISKLEAGEVELSSSIRLAICNVFGVRKEWILTGEGDMYDNRWVILEQRAKELGDDIYTELSLLKAYKLQYRLDEALMEKKFTPLEKEYIDKLLIILRHKDQGTISAITQNIDTFLRIPTEERPLEEEKKTKKA